MGRAVTGRTRYGARARTRTIRSSIQRVASSATERDQLICVDLYEHRVLTTNQLFELHFTSVQRTRARLLRLHDMGVLWRNRPRAHLGSLPWHYTLDEIGAWIAAERLGVELREVGYRDDRKRTLVDSPRLRHTRAANSFFTRMCYVARSTESTVQVAEWRGEAWCARRWQAHVRPDGFARLEGPGGSLELLLELDLGTENRSRLEDKMDRYRILARGATLPTSSCSASRAKLAKQAPGLCSAERRCRWQQPRSTGILPIPSEPSGFRWTGIGGSV